MCKNAARCKKYITTNKICSALQISSKSFVYLQRTAFLFFKNLKGKVSSLAVCKY